jgi:hypothetical protein
MTIPVLEHPTATTWIRLIVGFACWAVMATCGLWSGLLHMDRVDEVNKLLPVNQRFDILWWHAGKSRRFENEYRRLFPGSTARDREFKLLIIFAAALIVMAVDVALPF